MTHDFHVHGTHEHEVEHQAHHQGPGLAQYVAIFTALMSTIGAVVSYHISSTQNESLLLKNEAVLKKTQASDTWNYYQATSTKGHLMELAADLSDKPKAAHYRDLIAKYTQEKAQIRSQAEALEKESLKANEQSMGMLRPFHRSEQAISLIQIAISLASITALTRKRWLFAVAGVAAGGGLIIAGMAFLT